MTRGCYQRKGHWWMRYADAAGLMHKESVTWKKLADAGIKTEKNGAIGEVLAGKLYNSRVAGRNKGENPQLLHQRRILFRELVADAKTHARANNLGWKHDWSRLDTLDYAFGQMPAEIPIATLRRWFEAQEWTPASYNRTKTVLRSLYSLAIDNGKAASNPARALKRRREDNTKLRFLSQPEDKALRVEIAESWPWHLPEFLIALHTGMRPSEQYRLEWSNVDFTRRQIAVLRSKTGKPRYIPINSECMSALRQIEARPLRGQKVFLNEEGNPLVGYKHWFNPAVKASGVKDFTWYGLRHTFASRLVLAGVDLRTVAELMGHKTIQMTMRYAHLASEHTLAAVEKLASTGTFTGTNETGKPVETGQVVVLQ